jgi:hypothetical protein
VRHRGQPEAVSLSHICSSRIVKSGMFEGFFHRPASRAECGVVKLDEDGLSREVALA